eukprot:8412713-Pyramimonas_sp.AAC.1
MLLYLPGLLSQPARSRSGLARPPLLGVRGGVVRALGPPEVVPHRAEFGGGVPQEEELLAGGGPVPLGANQVEGGDGAANQGGRVGGG